MNWLRRGIGKEGAEGSDPKDIVTSPMADAKLPRRQMSSSPAPSNNNNNNNKRGGGLLVGGLGGLLGPGKAKAKAEAGKALRLAAVLGQLGELGRLLEMKHGDPNAADEV
jgi:hypothetical protein